MKVFDCYFTLKKNLSAALIFQFLSLLTILMQKQQCYRCESVSPEWLWICRLTGSSVIMRLPGAHNTVDNCVKLYKERSDRKHIKPDICRHCVWDKFNFLFQVATANLAWASVAIHQVQVSKCPQKTGLNSQFHIVADTLHCNTSPKTFLVTRWNLPIQLIMIFGGFVCSGSAPMFFLTGKSTVYRKWVVTESDPIS